MPRSKPKTRTTRKPSIKSPLQLMAASATEKTLTGVGNLIRLLPTGTVFLFQFLSPILTNSGQCEPINKSLSIILILFCGLSCFLSSFTDSYTGDDGALHWGFATASGMWPSPESKVDLSPYKLRAGDFVHATFSALVFGALVVLDSDTMKCFFPSFAAADKLLVQVLPPVVGAVSSVVFVMFPNTRHGIGYYDSSATPGGANSPLVRRGA
ncbi:protein DMP2-like [Cucurbita moschata]|uniref:Protein DMP2-like n=1 Tax=Cucurbita moschata TaxID=3662 RepID=A0A6J1GS26_CUCMO|nr:protein DMP2-like [Cucurbita moschata]